MRSSTLESAMPTRYSIHNGDCFWAGMKDAALDISALKIALMSRAASSMPTRYSIHNGDCFWAGMKDAALDISAIFRAFGLETMLTDARRSGPRLSDGMRDRK